jgi:uncharacterized protein YbjT (DUF2867 family)
MMRITVTTPTGHIGHELADRLLSQGVDLTVLARHPEKTSDLATRGARVVRGDQTNVGSVESALEGAEAFFWLTPVDLAATNVREHYNRFADVASQAIGRYPDVRVVHLSSVGAELPDRTGPIKGLHDVEAKLNAATSNVTHLRANYFMENVLSSLPTIVARGAIFSTIAGNVTQPQVATRDIAAVAAELLLNGDRGQHVLDVFGPEDISFDQVAQTLAEVLGVPVKHVQVSREQLRSGMLAAGLSPDFSDRLLELNEAIAQGWLHGVAESGRQGKTTFAEFARQVVVRAYRHYTAKAG